MILECIVTSLDSQARPNIAPMGPVVDDDDTQLGSFVLRPYQTSQTFTNLRRQSQGILHVTDNVLLMAQAAISHGPSLPELRPATKIAGQVLVDTCRWYEFVVDSYDDSLPRTTFQCRTVHRGRRRDFVGFNRAKHAVVEAAILMTRLDFLPAVEIRQQLDQLEIVVDKTAGNGERAAFRLLVDYFESRAKLHSSNNHG